jgi:hypothetical protein
VEITRNLVSTPWLSSKGKKRMGKCIEWVAEELEGLSKLMEIFSPKNFSVSPILGYYCQAYLI